MRYEPHPSLHMLKVLNYNLPLRYHRPALYYLIYIPLGRPSLCEDPATITTTMKIQTVFIVRVSPVNPKT